MMKLATVAVLACWLAPGTAAAQLVPGVRVGYAASAGDLHQGAPMSDGLDSQVPIQLDLGWRLLPRLVVGIYGAYGIAQVGKLCIAGADCSGSVLDLGAQAAWRFGIGKVSPWAGAGIGYEWGKYLVRVGGDRLDVRVRGPEFVRLVGGVDFVLGEKFALGPFLQWGFGRYANLDSSGPLGSFSGGIPDKSTHSWLTIGVRGTFDSFGDAATPAAAEPKAGGS
jgi:hypothetical protein